MRDGLRHLRNVGTHRIMRRKELRDLLGRYAPTDPSEALFRDRMLTLLEMDGAFDRGHVTPGHFTASAFVLAPGEDALLLIFHKKLSLWLQPGGHVEAGDESVLAAARREVEEEVGLRELEVLGKDDTLFDIDVHPIPPHKGEPAHEHFDVRFLFRSPSRAVAESEEVAGVQWVPLGDIPRLTSDESVQRAVRKIR